MRATFPQVVTSLHSYFQHSLTNCSKFNERLETWPPNTCYLIHKQRIWTRVAKRWASRNSDTCRDFRERSFTPNPCNFAGESSGTVLTNFDGSVALNKML